MTNVSQKSIAGDQPIMADEVWAKPADKVLEEFTCDVSVGLSTPEVNRRRQRYGPNLLSQHKKKSIWIILVEQFRSLIIGLLAVAAGVAFWFNEWIEGWAILVVILINALIGFFTELRAVRSMEALQKLGRVSTRVRRDGQVTEVEATELVPGDVVIIEGGDIITADLRIIGASRLQADESTLTGESMPVGKGTEPVLPDTILAERNSMLYKGTSVTRGAGEGVVVATGKETELGQISSLVEESEEEQTPLEERLDRLGYRLIIITLIIAVFVVVSGIMAGKRLFLMIETGIALAVAAIPEGLPIVATIALAKGLRIMASRNAVINRLSSVETLGATGIICTDKTGTLTENRMTVTEIVLPGRNVHLNGQDGSTMMPLGGTANPKEGKDLQLLLEVAVLCNNANLSQSIDADVASGTGDPLEVALLSAAQKAGINSSDLHNRYPEAREEAFDPEVKMMATWNRSGDSAYRVHVKGAPGVVLDACDQLMIDAEPRPFAPEVKEKWRQTNRDLAAKGLRILAFAMKDVKTTDDNPYNKLVFIGLVALFDPPRKDVKISIDQCYRAGIRVIMVTGDQVETARYIAGQIGLHDGKHPEVIHGNELLSNKELEVSLQDRKRVMDASIFARISPRQKLDLIEFYQKNGQIVAMTGDGVNDAPALKKADIGIAMGMRGTQVAREAADMVLTDDSFGSIVAAIEQGRIIFGNIRRFIYYLMSCNVSEVLVVGMASLIGAPLPILPLQILFLNLVTDVFPALALGVGEGEEGVMQKPPRKQEESILENRHWAGIFTYGLIITTSVLGSLFVGLELLGLNTEEAITISFLTLAFSQLWHVFNMRSVASSVFDNTIVRNPWMWIALVLCVLFLLTAVYFPPVARVLKVQPPALHGWGVVLLFSLLPLIAGQIQKSFKSIRFQETKPPCTESAGVRDKD